MKILPLIAVAISLLCLSGCVSGPTDLTLSQAVTLAESFIATNGYTDLPPSKSGLRHESIETESDPDKILQQRHNTLERKAYAAMSEGSGPARRWIVAFRYTRSFDSKIGRAVTMGLDGGNIKMEHQDIFLDSLAKVRLELDSSPIR